MKCKVAILAAVVAGFVSAAPAQEGTVPTGVPHLDHVFLIMMENHGFNQVYKNPQMPWSNKYGTQVNSALSYYAVGHPSSTNYLEIVGGSNFGVRNDDSPDWHNTTCTPNLATGAVSLESSSTPICPISGTGTDAATPVIDISNETSGPPGVIDVDGIVGYTANPNTVGKTIADQLVTAGLTWKTYQEDLPLAGPDMINTADGYFTNLTDIGTALPGSGLTDSSLIGLYAVKHNPFAYFASVQQGTNPQLSFANMASFAGKNGFFADIVNNTLPAFSYIVPNQCHDQHGRGNAGPDCAYDPADNGTQTGLNPALMFHGDQELRLIVEAIHATTTWQTGKNAIVIVWDENDYSISPITNQVALTVEINYSPQGVVSKNFYTHFSLLKSLEAGFGLPCLNHACDTNTQVMSDLFGNPQPALRR